MTVDLRAATAVDSARIAEILLASRKAFLPYAQSPHSDDEVRAWVRDELLAAQQVHVALVQRQIVGVLALAQIQGVSWLTQLYLDPLFVGQGIGSRLLTRAVATAPRPIRLYTFQQNLGARRFYERNGFVPMELSDGSSNEERCPDVLYELASSAHLEP